MAHALEARALYRRVCRAARAICVPYVRRQTVSNYRDAMALYADARYDADRGRLLSGAAADIATLEKLLAQPPSELAAAYRKNVAHLSDRARL